MKSQHPAGSLTGTLQNNLNFFMRAIRAKHAHTAARLVVVQTGRCWLKRDRIGHQQTERDHLVVVCVPSCRQLESVEIERQKNRFRHLPTLSAVVYQCDQQF